MANTAPEKKANNRGLRKSMVGIVTSDKMMKTVVVTVSRKVKDPLYQKYVTHKSKFKAHDEKNEAKVGDTVLIYETAPISKDKKWKLGKILSRGVEV
jgi:small subunit ribosomal protein S17